MTDIKPLLQISDKIIAEEIKRILEEAGIFSLLESSNPASSFINTYIGSAAQDDITISVTLTDYAKASEVIKEHGYKDLMV
ncbi:putative signal transducing protein [Labilibacter marinus]|uniref:putative signal transducing protein n=1 Tax=Labilibacter marinus TaxID=1477105 RepID=UPI00094F77CD|nr:DUF2007 domain-containing protein [Labilibacter marinus]